MSKGFANHLAILLLIPAGSVPENAFVKVADPRWPDRRAGSPAGSV
jgi:hypothetical protein